MTRAKSTSARPTDRSTDRPTDPQPAKLPDAVTQIREAQDAIVAAIISKAQADGSYQHAKWLFEFAGINPAGHSAPEDQPSLLRLFLDQLQIPESPEEILDECSANDHAVE